MNRYRIWCKARFVILFSNNRVISKSNKIATSKCNFAKIQMISRKEFIFRVICISASFPESIFKKDSVFYWTKRISSIFQPHRFIQLLLILIIHYSQQRFLIKIYLTKSFKRQLGITINENSWKCRALICCQNRTNFVRFSNKTAHIRINNNSNWQSRIIKGFQSILQRRNLLYRFYNGNNRFRNQFLRCKFL